MGRALTLSLPKPLQLTLPEFRHVNLTLVGCGGTGSHLASGLVAILQAIEERGVRSHVIFIDPDTVEPKNVGRQLFSLADVGRPKAEALAERLNAAFGTRIGAVVRPVDAEDTFFHDDRQALNIVLGAVDNAAARAVIAGIVAQAQQRLWWLDCGNEDHSGQVALGNCCRVQELRRVNSLGLINRLPAPHLVYPDLVRTPRAAARRPRLAADPSCADLTAAGQQGLMVNRMAAAWALSMLSDFLITRDLHYFALAFDLAWGGVRAYTLDEATLADVLGSSRKRKGA